MDKLTSVEIRETTREMVKTSNATKSSQLVERSKARLYDDVLKFLTR